MRSLKLGASLRDDRRSPIENLKTQYFKHLAQHRLDGPTEYELRRNFDMKRQHKLLQVIGDQYDPLEFQEDQVNLKDKTNVEDLDERYRKQLNPDEKKPKPGSALFHRPFPIQDEMSSSRSILLAKPLNRKSTVPHVKENNEDLFYVPL